MNSNFENLIKTQINGILEAFTSDLEKVLEGKDFFSQEEKKKIYEDFLNVLEFISSYEDEVDPKIKDKINHIKRLLNTSSDVYEGEEHPLNITPLSDVQEN
jgi:DNA-binding transcriptional regulator GbsR (MarR family)